MNRESEILWNKAPKREEIQQKQETDNYCKNQGNSHKVPPAQAQRVYTYFMMSLILCLFTKFPGLSLVCKQCSFSCNKKNVRPCWNGKFLFHVEIKKKHSKKKWWRDNYCCASAKKWEREVIAKRRKKRQWCCVLVQKKRTRWTAYHLVCKQCSFSWNKKNVRPCWNEYLETQEEEALVMR
jgi:hypothetical protein